MIGIGSIVQAGASILGGAIQSRAQRAAGKAQLEQAKYNKEVYDNRAKAIDIASSAEQRRIAKQQRKAAGETKVAFAKSGVQISSGTPLVAQLDQFSDMVYDLNNFKRSQALKAAEQTQAGEMALYQGKMANQQARAQARATMMSSVLTGIGQLAAGYKPNNPTFGEAGSKMSTTPSTKPFVNYNSPIAPIGSLPSFSRSMSGFRF
jgi:hypothetical protein|tara:strand:- start:5872 stop:6489 length:618 start_codon:yes stop_codon:yes gene_type:complete